LKPLDFFATNDNINYRGKVILPSSLISPNVYSFACAIWTKDGIIHDLVENICMVKIYDNGTDLALYEGGDHGSVIINPTWVNA